MKVTYVRGWTSPVCDIKLSCPQKRPYSYIEHTRRRANVRDVLSLSVLARIWIFFPKKELFKFVRELFAKRGVIHQRRNCTMRRVNRFEARILHAQNIQNKI